jgi:hypothetical protein
MRGYVERNAFLLASSSRAFEKSSPVGALTGTAPDLLQAQNDGDPLGDNAAHPLAFSFAVGCRDPAPRCGTARNGTERYGNSFPK